jgi:histidine triad (HIT) family protein
LFLEVKEMDECIFCEIVRKRSPATIRYEDLEVIAFDSIARWAPTHILICPKAHCTLDQLMLFSELSGKLLKVAYRIAEARNLVNREKGFRVVANFGRDGHQTIEHAHFHLLGGKYLGLKFAG